MATNQLEERVAILENEVARLKISLAQGDSSPEFWWERIRGSFAGEPDFDEAMKLGREYRESKRPQPAGPRKD